MEPAHSPEPKLKVVAHEGIVGVRDLSGQDAEHDIGIGAGIVHRAPDIKPDPRPRGQVRVANGLPKRIPRYVEIGWQGHRATRIEHQVEGDRGAGANSPGCGAIRCTASPVMVTTSLG